MKIDIGGKYVLSTTQDNSFKINEIYGRDAEYITLDTTWDLGEILVTPSNWDEVGLIEHIISGSNDELDPSKVFEEWEFLSCAKNRSDNFITEGYWDDDNKKHVRALHESSGHAVGCPLEEIGFELENNDYVLSGVLDVREW